MKPLRWLDAMTDRLILRLVAPLGVGGILALTGGTYIVLGIIVPLALGGSRWNLIVFGALGAASLMVLTLAWTWTRVEVRDRRHLLEWTTDLRRLNAREFEWLVGQLLRREGWQVEETGQHGAPDGNIDIRAHRAGVTRLVQCKCWKRWHVGVDEVRELGGTLMREGLTGNDGTLVTLSHFSPQAEAEASELGIELVDGTTLHERLADAREAAPCPTCGTPMILAHSGHGWWLRCPRYPDCKGKQDLGAEPGRAVELLLSS